jgi:hypothetical protein
MRAAVEELDFPKAFPTKAVVVSLETRERALLVVVDTQHVVAVEEPMECPVDLGLKLSKQKTHISGPFDKDQGQD